MARDADPADGRAGVADRYVHGVSTAGFLDQHAVVVRFGAGIGLVVDDAIVVVEAVEKHIEDGLSPRDASFKAMEQVSSP